MRSADDPCPECGQKELRPDVTQGVTDCVNCGWSESWLESSDFELDDILEGEGDGTPTPSSSPTSSSSGSDEE